MERCHDWRWLVSFRFLVPISASSVSRTVESLVSGNTRLTYPLDHCSCPHRYLRMTSDSSDANRSVVFADPPGSDHFIEAKVPIGPLNAEIMDAAFTKAVGCTQYPGGCDGMRRDHRFADAVPLGENWRHKYLIDLDGMGYSARYFSLLASESAVLKTSVYTEFFSGEQGRCSSLSAASYLYLARPLRLRRLDRTLASLYPCHSGIRRDIQHLVLLLRTHASHDRCCQPNPSHVRRSKGLCRRSTPGRRQGVAEDRKGR